MDIHGGIKLYYFGLWHFWTQHQSANLSESREIRGQKVLQVNEMLQEWDENHEDMLAQFIFEHTIKNPTGFSIPDLIAYYENKCQFEITQNQMNKILKMYSCEYDSDTKVYYGVINKDRKEEYHRSIPIFTCIAIMPTANTLSNNYR